MIAPPQLVRPLVAARQFQDGYTSALAQMTLFTSCTRGLRRASAQYAHAVQGAAGRAVRRGASSPCGLDAPGAAGRAAAGLPVGGCGDGAAAGGGGRAGPGYGLADFYTGMPQRGALVLGFSAYTPDEIVRFIATLAQVFSALPVESDG